MSTTIKISEIIDLDDLPSPPAVASRILDLFSDSSISNEELEIALGADPILSARVMTYANSPTVNFGKEVSTIGDAISLLGIRIIKTIALSFSLTSPQESNAIQRFDFDAFWNCSLVRGVAAKVLAQKFSHDPELGFLSGLMLEIGELALAYAKKTKSQILDENPQLKTDRPFAICHPGDDFDYYKFGGLLLEQWKFPIDVIENVSTLCSNPDPSDFQKCLMLAAGIGRMIFDDCYEFDQIQQVKQFAADKMQISNDQFEALFAQVLDAWIENSLVLQNESMDRSVQQIESEAKKQITSLSLNLQQENILISEENEVLRQMAIVDQLTGLGNRRAWEQHGQAEWERANRSGETFALMFVDIDHFKKVNDSFGHAVGDIVLVHVATMLKQEIRRYDHVFRFGGEEFVIILPQCKTPTTKVVAKRLLEGIARAPVSFAGNTIEVTVSIGISQWNPDHHKTLDQMFDDADRQLYLAKNRGRNQFCIEPFADVATTSDA